MIENQKYISKINKHTDVILDVTLFDHIGGFDINYYNEVLYHLNNRSEKVIARSEYIFDDIIKDKYPNIKFIFDINQCISGNHYNDFINYNIHPEINFKNFVCSFNGSDHVSRQILTAILSNQGMFNPNYSSKNFSYNNNWIIGQLDHLDLDNDGIKFYTTFFKNPDDFNNKIYSFGHVQYNHAKNIYNLENKLTQSFLHLVSESMATSYYPFITEKFLYSVVTRGLFLSYAQPMWHQHLEKYYGFRKYNKIFNYDFDLVKNPVKRLIRLVEMISKFKNLSTDDWIDLYLMEQDTIEYNYDHYFSGDYLKFLIKYEY
jgi:hypothetical protein